MMPFIFISSYGLSFLYILRGSPLLASQSISVPSWLPLAMVFPSGLKAIDQTQLPWPCSIWRQFPVVTFHTRMVLSWLPLATLSPSGLKATDRIYPLWSFRILLG